MKIGLIVPGFSADERDWCIPALLNLARSLAACHEVQVLALRYPPKRSVYRMAGVQVQSLNGQTRHGMTSVQLWGTALTALWQEHHAARFDVLHAVYGGEAGFLAVLASRLLRVPCVTSFVGGELAGLDDIRYGAELQPRQRWMNHLILRLADAVLGGSISVTQSARAQVPPARRARVQTLPLGVDTQLFSPARPTSHPGVNILNVGSLIPVKDQQTLLQAMALLLQTVSNARLTIIGNGPGRASLDRLARQLEIGNHVDLRGAVRHEELPGWYRRADLFVQSSRHEGEGMAVLEAAACGTALAGTAVGVLADLAERDAAVVSPPNDPVALASAMQQAFVDRANLGTSACQMVQQEYGLEQIRERLNKLYRSLARRRQANVVKSLSHT